MTDRLVSCIVGVHNGERYLEETLRSILGQSWRPIEVLVIDDGSTDGTAAVARRLAPDVEYRWQPNAGPAAARNTGIRAARGDCLAFLDADDLWHPEKIARQMACLAARPELGFCLAHVQNFWEPELHEEAERFQGQPRSRPLPGWTTPALLVRRSALETVGLFDESLRHSSETAWFLAAADRGMRGEVLPDVLVFRRLHAANRSRMLAANSWDEYLGLVRQRIAARRRGGRTE